MSKKVRKLSSAAHRTAQEVLAQADEIRNQRYQVRDSEQLFLMNETIKKAERASSLIEAAADALLSASEFLSGTKCEELKMHYVRILD